MEKNKIKGFGNVVGLTKAIKDVNFYLSTGNRENEKFPELEKDLLDKLALNGVFDPRKAVLLRSLFNDNKENTKEYQDLLEEKKEPQKQFMSAIGQPLKEWVKTEIGENKKLVLIAREKIISRKGNYVEKRDMNYTPKEMDFFNNPLKDDKEGSSVYVAQATTDVADITNQKLIKIGVGSICYDHIKKQYVTHQWIFTYDVVEELISAETASKLENELDEMESIL
ncbi:hypothetical protein C4N15_07275 [Fusobacterium necrophorum subsp. funduliforme]|jgi:hypothetical protein|uniref:hypothetical protein n=1 Tax=Fusobacterium necrophorum TaxID=859 RepID=UPI000D12A043|nr:hypothetical protein [Fusobacterium necrophorum]AVQ21458.1 hypothetical protein C4N15_07275 [Fusobacterium necrophorum subsp. funduliforme]